MTIVESSADKKVGRLDGGQAEPAAGAELGEGLGWSRLEFVSGGVNVATAATAAAAAGGGYSRGCYWALAGWGVGLRLWRYLSRDPERGGTWAAEAAELRWLGQRGRSHSLTGDGRWEQTSSGMR